MLIYLQALDSEADRSKFERIYDRYRALMLRAARRIVSNQSDAEDTVHQAFLSLLEHLDLVSAVDSPQTRALVVLITERRAIDLVRTQQKVIPMEPEALAQGLAVPPTGHSVLADALLRLRAQDREVLLLRYALGYSAREIAKLLGMEHEAVRKRILRAKHALQAELEQEGVTI